MTRVKNRSLRGLVLLITFFCLSVSLAQSLEVSYGLNDQLLNWPSEPSQMTLFAGTPLNFCLNKGHLELISYDFSYLSIKEAKALKVYQNMSVNYYRLFSDDEKGFQFYFESTPVTTHAVLAFKEIICR